MVLHLCGSAQAAPLPPLTVTASHVVMARRKGLQPQAFRPHLAAELQPGDHLRSHSTEHRVSSVEWDLRDTAVVEVELRDVRASFFIGGAEAVGGHVFEVYGALAPLGGSVIWLVRFDRFDRFRDIFLENPELALVRTRLQEAGYSVDLGSVTNLGPAKLLVRPALVPRVLRALQLRSRTSGEKLRLWDVIVADELKFTVLEEVWRLSPRENRVRCEELLELEPGIRNRNTFAELGDASSSSAATALQSSTDAHLGSKRNPRKRDVAWPL